MALTGVLRDKVLLGASDRIGDGDLDGRIDAGDLDVADGYQVSQPLLQCALDGKLGCRRQLIEIGRAHV